MRSFLVYLQATLLTGLILFFALDLGKADLRIPLYYSSGTDTHFFIAMNKTVAETGWYVENPKLGAPGTMKLYDFPIVETEMFLCLKLLCLVVGESFLAGNLFYLGTYLLATWSALYVMRQFKVKDQAAVAASLLFSFTPYHLWRGVCHMPLSNYFAIPLVVMVSLWLAAGEPLFVRRDGAGRLSLGWIRGRTLPSLAACLLIALTGAYYAYFGTFLLIIGGAIGFVRKSSMDRLLNLVFTVGLVVGCFVLQLLPFVIAARREGPNPGGALERSIENYYVYALSAQDLFLPVTGHRLSRFTSHSAFWRDVEPRDLPYLLGELNEGKLCSPLGLLGSFGLLVSIVAMLGAPFSWTRNRPAIGDASKLAAALLLLGFHGGLGELIALNVTLMIRCYNRISIFLAFLSLFVLASAVSMAADRWPKKRLSPLVWFVTILALLDQIPSGAIPDYRRDAAQFRGDARFIRQIEQVVRPGGMIAQFPQVLFPAQGKTEQMRDYNHFRGYFHSRDIHWSYGAMRGRDIEKLQSSLADLPAPELVKQLSGLGFEGIYVNLDGYEQSEGQEFIASLMRVMPQTPIRNESGELIFFRLPSEDRQGRVPAASL